MRTLPTIGEVASVIFHAQLKCLGAVICSIQGVAYARPDAPDITHVAWLPEDVEEPIAMPDPWRRERYGTPVEDAIAETLWKEARSPKVKRKLSAAFDDWQKERWMRSYGDSCDAVRHAAE